MKALLFGERPLIVSPTLALMLGTNEAIFLQQLHYWLEKSRNIVDGRTWVYNSFDGWAKQIRILSPRTIQRIVQRLLAQGVIEVSHHGTGRFDRTNWYTLDYERLSQQVEAYRAETGTAGDREEVFPASDHAAISARSEKPVCRDASIHSGNMEQDSLSSSIASACQMDGHSAVANVHDKLSLPAPETAPDPISDASVQNDHMEQDSMPMAASNTSACCGEIRHTVAEPYDTVSFSTIQENTTENTTENTSESISGMAERDGRMDRGNPDAPYRRLCALFSHVHHPITGNEAKELRRIYHAQGETATELALLRSKGAHKPLRYMAAVLKNLTEDEIAAFVREQKKGEDSHGGIGTGRQKFSGISRQGQRTSCKMPDDGAKYYTSVPW